MANTLTLLDAANAETTGGAFEVVTGRAITFASFASGGGTTAPNYQGSLDGANWFALGSGSTPLVVTVPVKYIRAYYPGSTGAGVVTVQAIQSDFED